MISRAAIDTEQKYRRHDVHDAISREYPTLRPSLFTAGLGCLSPRIRKKFLPSFPSRCSAISAIMNKELDNNKIFNRRTRKIEDTNSSYSDKLYYYIYLI